MVIFTIISRRKNESRTIEKIKKNIEKKTNEPLTLHPEINPALCAGCGGT